MSAWAWVALAALAVGAALWLYRRGKKEGASEQERRGVKDKAASLSRFLSRVLALPDGAGSDFRVRKPDKWPKPPAPPGA